MNKKILVCVIAIAVFSLAATACTRSASGGPSDIAKAETTIPNPVSTQSQVMKDIIAGTQTAMAMPAEPELADGAENAPDGNTGIQVAGIIEISGGAGVKPPGALFQFLNYLHGSDLGRSGDRSARKARCQRIDRRFSGAKGSGDR